MAFRDEFDLSIPKEHGFFWGSVVRNDDPERLGRVKIFIPGVLEPESPWAWPVGFMGGGSEQQGSFFVPRTGATVVVGFIQGDKDELFYMAGPHRISNGSPGTPTSVAEETSAVQTPNVRAIETETFEIVIKDTASEKKLILRSKGDDSGGEIEIDAVDKSIVINSDTTMIIRSTGILDIQAARVQIQNRVVMPIGNPI